MRTLKPGNSNSSSALKCRCAKNKCTYSFTRTYIISASTKYVCSPIFALLPVLVVVPLLVEYGVDVADPLLQCLVLLPQPPHLLCAGRVQGPRPLQVLVLGVRVTLLPHTAILHHGKKVQAQSLLVRYLLVLLLDRREKWFIIMSPGTELSHPISPCSAPRKEREMIYHNEPRHRAFSSDISLFCS